MPRSKNNIKRSKPSEAVKAAAEKVPSGQSWVREAALEYNVTTSTLSRYLIKHRNEVIDSQPVRGPSGITHITPDKIQPFPKAQARKGVKRGGRKLGRCRILTDTPEKTELEEEAAMRERKSKCKKKTTIKNIIISHSSSSSDEEKQSISSGGSLEDIDWEKPESEGELPNGEIKVDGFVLVKLMGKKSIKFYVAKVVEMLSDDVLAVRYLKKLVGGKFIFHNETVYEISTSEVVMILPFPQVGGGTERRSHQMRFSVDFSSYNVE